MKKFKFRLEALHKIRSFEEEKCKIDLGKILKEIGRLKAEIMICEEAVGQSYQSQNDGAANGMIARELVFFPDYVESQRQRIKILEDDIAKMEALKEEKTQNLKVLRAKTKVLEKLREKDYQTYIKTLNKKTDDLLEEEVQRWLHLKKS